jgi:GT2 family glycosyltransferase
MSVSVVINTYNRRAGLEHTLDGLRRQTFRAFEVVVVHGPSTDGTAALLDRLGDRIRVVPFAERHLGRSRNAGIDAAAGDIVAFIDDDAVPESRWLEDLVAAYDDEGVGGAGGLVLDHTGVRPQYRYSVCTRAGELDFDREPPLERYLRPGADPFLYLQGTNCSFRRAALVDIGGFDEEIEYNFDEAEVCLRLIDAGWSLRALETAVVRHRFLPSDRRNERTFTDPYLEVKNRVYFGLRNGPDRGGALASANRHLGLKRVTAREAARRGELSEHELARYLGRADAGFHLGLQRGLTGERRGRRLAGQDRGCFRAYPVLRPAPRRRVALLDEFAARARELADAGHEVHTLVPAGAAEAYRIDFRDGVWVHTVPVGPRWLPELEGAPLRASLEAAAALRGALAHVQAREPVELEGDLPAPLEGFLDAGEQEVEALLVREAGLPPPAAGRVARRMLELHRFPIDHELGVRACLEIGDDGRFVDCLYATLLGREPEKYGRETSLSALRAGDDRTALVERVARSTEARGRGVDATFVNWLPEPSVTRARAGLLKAWLLPEKEFAPVVRRLLLDRLDAVRRGVRRVTARPRRR